MSQTEILCGPIGSGKSTYARHRARQGAIIVNDDAIVMAVHAGIYNLYKKELKPLYKCIENTILQAAIMLGKDVVIDRPNYSKEMRSRYISIARSLDCKIHIVFFPEYEPDVHVTRRVTSDIRGMDYQAWMAVFMAHKDNYSKPSLDEADEITYLTAQDIKNLQKDEQLFTT